MKVFALQIKLMKILLIALILMEEITLKHNILVMFLNNNQLLLGSYNGIMRTYPG